MEEAKYIKVKAAVRYWEDTNVNGVDDEDGHLIPFHNGDFWEPTIDIENGIVINWPYGITAHIHYKVCDAGEHWLLDKGMEVIAKYGGYYVPNRFLCHVEIGYGDYIIFNVDGKGAISDFVRPVVHKDEWEFD